MCTGGALGRRVRCLLLSGWGALDTLSVELYQIIARNETNN